MNRDATPTSIPLAGTAAGDDRVAAVHRCHLKLADLTDTADPDVKFCDHCRHKVYRVEDLDGFERAVASGRCVWGSLDGPGRNEERNYFGGPVILYDPSSSRLTWDD